MGLLQQITDRYTRHARFLPAVLVSLPILVLCLTAVPVAVSIWSKVAAVAAFSLPFVISQVVRDRGLQIQPRLFESWDGRPSEHMLRWREAKSKTVVERRHRLISKHLEIELPDEFAEAADPVEADEVYAAATSILRERTRDSSRFPLVFEENIAYGFRRNSYACRVPAVIVCVIAAVSTIALARFSVVPLGWKQQTALVGFDLLLAAGWWRLCTRDAVKRAAEKYAAQLYASLDALGTPQQEPGVN